MDEKDKRIQDLKKTVKAQVALIQKLEARIAELERRLGLDSSNSTQCASFKPLIYQSAKVYQH